MKDPRDSNAKPSCMWCCWECGLRIAASGTEILQKTTKGKTQRRWVPRNEEARFGNGEADGMD